MSIKLMHAAWDLDMPTGMKFVLVSLADQASDTGECWPSIDTIAARTSMAARTVQMHIKALESEGFIARIERPGRSTVYRLDPRRICTPAEFAPPQKTAKTPAEFAPPPAEFAPPPAESAPITITETSLNPQEPKKTRDIAPVPDRPADVSEPVWLSFLALRKARRAPLSTVALDGLRRESGKAGLPLEDVLKLCCERGWQSFNAGWGGGAASQGTPPRRPPAPENLSQKTYQGGRL